MKGGEFTTEGTEDRRAKAESSDSTVMGAVKCIVLPLCSLCVLWGSVALPALAQPPAIQRPSPLKSGIEFQGADVKALQADDFANPGMLWVQRGEKLWMEFRGENRWNCAGCHGVARASMRGVANRYPRYDAALGRVVNLEQRINACVTQRQKAPELAWESDELLGLTAYIALQSRGLPIAVQAEPRGKEAWEHGRRLYFTRIGQLNLACSHCHDASWGKTLLAEKLSQGHPTGWPAYRLEWQRMGSLQRRLRACFHGIRAEMPPYGSPDLVALELYLATRAQGLRQEAPGVRR